MFENMKNWDQKIMSLVTRAIYGGAGTARIAVGREKPLSLLYRGEAL
ncbi:MAG: hypothetical protein LBO66_14520 [Deltaproteobacteria bacterium]|jgi:hypothetical protein|nr:hypothetical protein [Deltaproteobacteria bacterium]